MRSPTNTVCPECGEEHAVLFRGCPWCLRKRKEGETVRDVNRRMLRGAVTVHSAAPDRGEAGPAEGAE